MINALYVKILITLTYTKLKAISDFLGNFSKLIKKTISFFYKFKGIFQKNL